MQNPFRYFNNSPEVIRSAVMLYVRYPLSLRQVEDLLFERGIDICHETVRYWWNRFGPLFAAEIRKRRIRHGSYSLWRWHLDEVFVRINGETHYLWRAVDHEGEVLEVLATKRRGIVRLNRLELKSKVFYPPAMYNPFRYFNSSPEVIRLAVMTYIRYPLSLRQVEDILFERGIDICHETIRYWWNRFGPLFASEIRKRRTDRRNWSNWRWHLDEVFVRINGETHYLWRAVDHEGEVLEVFATKRRDREAALRVP